MRNGTNFLLASRGLVDTLSSIQAKQVEKITLDIKKASSDTV